MGWVVAAKAEPKCDFCGLESEPCELTGTAHGGFSMDGPIAELRRDGWLVDCERDLLTCPDCQSLLHPTGADQ